MSNIAQQQRRVDECKEKIHQLGKIAHAVISEMTDLSEQLSVEIEILQVMTIPDEPDEQTNNANCVLA